jgi:hypothetical protein
MYIRDINSSRISSSQPVKKRRLNPISVLLFLLFVVVGWLFLGTTTHAATPGSPIKSGWSGYCLDDYLGKVKPGNKIDLWTCNNSSAQNWQVNLTSIKHDGMCLTAQSNTNINLNNCIQGANQVWIRDNQGFINPNSHLCLTAPQEEQGISLILASCNELTSVSKIWQPNVNFINYPCTGDQGQKVACYAIKEWIRWTTEPNNHEALLNAYTGGAPYEEWCADFVSYVYKEAGYPFKYGNYDNWDENIAPDIVNQGFHVDNSPNYIPKPGDVGYFSYLGGHVEIVVSGGKKPTFIYGNSATIDPTTGNGQMETNTITRVKSLGKLLYYMSPTSIT